VAREVYQHLEGVDEQLGASLQDLLSDEPAARLAGQVGIAGAALAGFVAFLGEPAKFGTTVDGRMATS